MAFNPVGFSAVRLQRLTYLLQGYIERGELPCASLVISHRGEMVYREKFGWLDIEARKPLDFDTIFRIMSMTKPVTALAAMLLYEEGAFDLNTPIHRYLPAYKNIRVIRHRQDNTLEIKPAHVNLTFRHLFTHTSGIGYGSDPSDPADAEIHSLLKPVFEGNKAYSVTEFAECLSEVPLAFEPGEGFRYGLNLDILAALIEAISDLSFEDFLSQRIFEPLGMLDTGFNLPENKLNRLAVLYTREAETGLLKPRQAVVPMPAPLWGGGGLVSTLGDYSRFTAMLANRGKLDGIRLVSPTTVAMFSQNWASQKALDDFVKTSPEINGGYGYSLGTAVLMDPSPTGKFGNLGEFYWGGAYSTYFWVDPKESLHGVFLSQFDQNWYYPLPWQIKQLTYQAMIG